MTSTDSTTPAETPPTKNKRGLLFRLVRFCFVAGLVLTLAAAATLFFARGWISEKTQAVLAAELDRRGIHVDYSNPRYSLTRGFVVSDLTLFRSAEKTKPLFAFSDIAARIDPVKTFSTKKAAVHVTGRDASLVATEGEETAAFSQINLDADLHGDLLEIHRLRGLFETLKVDLSADLPLQRSAGQNASSTPGEQSQKKRLSELNLVPLIRFAKEVQFDVRSAFPKLEAHFGRNNSGRLTVEGRFTGENFSWKGVPTDRIDLQFASRADTPTPVIEFPAFDLTYQGKNLSAAGLVDLKAGKVTVAKLDSSADILALTGALLGKEIPVRFTTPPRLNLEGAYIWKSPKASRLTARFSEENALIVPIGERELSLNNIQGTLTLSEGTVATEDLKAAVLDGAAAFAGSIRPFDEGAPYQGALSASGIPLASIAAFTGSGKERSGHLNLSFDGSGAKSLTALNGAGAIEVADARFITIPMFGRIVEIFKTLTLRFNKESPSGLTANYAVTNGVLSTEDLVISSEGVVIGAQGRINLADTATPDAAQLKAKAKFGGLVGAATSKITGLAEMEGVGPVRDVKWRPTLVPTLGDIKNLPEKIEQITGAVKNAGGQVKDIDQLPKAVAGELLKRLPGILGGKPAAPPPPPAPAETPPPPVKTPPAPATP